MKTDIGSTLSRRSLALGFASVLAFRAIPAFAGAKRHAGKSAAEKFLGSIYQRYLGKSSAAGSGMRLAEPRSVRSYFTPGLASLIDSLDNLRYPVDQTGLVNHDECSLGRIQ